jgi:hypothetical protein
VIAHGDDESTWLVETKADRILGVLPVDLIAHLGDGFPWAVTDDDVRVARDRLAGRRVRAIEIGRAIARLSEDDGAGAPWQTTSSDDPES